MKFKEFCDNLEKMRDVTKEHNSILQELIEKNRKKKISVKINPPDNTSVVANEPSMVIGTEKNQLIHFDA